MYAVVSSLLARVSVTGLGALLFLAGCAAGPNRHEPTLSFQLAIDVSITDSCGKLAGFFGLAELFDDLFPEQPFAIDSDSEQGLAKLRAEFENRCPDNAQPDLDNLEAAINIPTVACAELRSLMAMADAFGMVPTSGERQQAILEGLMASFEDELDRRCD
ncbi:MAG: hypothetical protein OXP36_13565 [Gammaproteobacteria bacterium]|nr:hypothetical protein [Gammaproteobacteria bacterium]